MTLLEICYVCVIIIQKPTSLIQYKELFLRVLEWKKASLLKFLATFTLEDEKLFGFIFLAHAGT